VDKLSSNGVIAITPTRHIAEGVEENLEGRRIPRACQFRSQAIIGRGKDPHGWHERC
jgi:hypothetical protein